MTTKTLATPTGSGRILKWMRKKTGILIIFGFFIGLCVLAQLGGIPVTTMLGNILTRTAMNGVLVLAVLPGIQSGIRLNFGLTIGIVAGLLAILLCIEFGLVGWAAFAFTLIVACVIAVPFGLLYGMLLNRVKGNEMTVSTYVGFSFIALMCIGWTLFPFHNNALKFALGNGLRVTHNMDTSFGGLLGNFGAFRIDHIFGQAISPILIPTGSLLFFLLCCGCLWLYSRSKTGVAMIAAGANPRLAEASGISVNKMRLIGTVLSTVIAAIGIVTYSMSYGFMQLYNAPRQMGFIAASAILIGGANVNKASVSQVIIGCFLFQGILSLGIQTANHYVAGGGLSEIMRMLISNGVILFALTKAGGGARE